MSALARPGRWVTDPRFAALALAISGLAALAAPPLLLPVAVAFLPATLAHVALTFPRPASLVQAFPSAISALYVFAIAPAALGLRAAGRLPEVSEVLSAILLSLGAGAAFAALARSARFALTPRGSQLRGPARIGLVGGLASVLAWLGPQPAGAPRLALWVAALAFPAAVGLALARRGGAHAIAPPPAGVSLEVVARGLAHAMLKPVNAVADRLTQLAQQASDTGAQRDLEEAARLMAQVQRLVRDVLELARAQAEPRRRHLAAARLVEQAVHQVVERFPGARLDVDVEAGAVAGDEVALRCALVNLLENAVEAGGPASRVALRVRERGSWIQITIEDESGGLPREVRERLFEPFVTTKPRGTGLGLAIVQEACRSHGGSVELSPTVRGTRVELRLPLSRPAVAAAVVGEVAAAVPPSASR